MSFLFVNNVKICGIAAAVPTKIVQSDDYKKLFGSEYVDKFKESTGVIQLRKTAEHQTASDLGYAAAEKILKEKDIDRSTIGALVFVAHSTDYRRPATACVLHKRLGLSKDCASFDISLGCSAFVYGLQVASSLMQSSTIQRALVIVGETLSKMVYPTDRSVAMLFGDGGAACLLEKTNEDSTLQGMLCTDGCGYRDIIAPAGGFRNMNAPAEPFIWEDGNERTLYNTIMKGDNVFGFTISEVPKTVKSFLEQTNTTVEDYDCFAFHQANKYISKLLCKKLKIPEIKMPLCLDRFGNTSAPAIPLAICDRYGYDNDGQDHHILMCGFGVGLSWGVCSAIVNSSDIFPVIETDIIFEEGIINSPEEFKK